MRACFWNKAAFTIFMNVGQYLTLPHYILNYHDYVIQAALLVPALLLATFLFFFLGIALFERNPLERSGQLLVFGDTRKVIQVVASLFIAVAGSTQESLSQEKKIRESLASLGKNHGIYLAVKGKIAADLDEEAQLAWGKAVFRGFGARITDTLRTDKYTSITGYSPVLPDVAVVGGGKINLNLSMVRKEQGIHVLLGTPLITCEY
jgi:hypothetical protein